MLAHTLTATDLLAALLLAAAAAWRAHTTARTAFLPPTAFTLPTFPANPAVLPPPTAGCAVAVGGVGVDIAANAGSAYDAEAELPSV